MLNKIATTVLHNRLMVTMFAALVISAGYYSYTKLPIDAFPDVSPNLVQVFTVTEGLAPEEIEQYVTFPVEAAMNGLPGVTKVRSVSNFGLSVVNIYFEDDMDIYFTRQIVSERLTEAREQIPEGFGEPGMGPISTGMGLVLFYYLEDTTGTRDLQEMRTLQDWLVKFHLQTVPGVTEVLGIGGYEQQFQVILHPEKLLQYQVSLTELIEIIRKNNLNVGAQFIEKNGEEFVVRSYGLVQSIEDLKNIIVSAESGTPVYLGQIAEIETGGAVRRGVQTRNGTDEVVAGMVVKLFGTNSSTVIERVESKLAEINDILPEGVKIVPYYEQKTIVSAAVKTVTDALFQGIVLVILVVLVFMGGFRPSVVVSLAIPISVLFAMILMRRLDMSANLMSLGGLAIAIGMLVDGAIVIVENIDRRLRSTAPSESMLKVISSACAEVNRPIIYAIVIIIVVFMPLLTLQGVEGKTFRPLAYTVTFAMLGSLLYAVFIAPVFSSFLIRRKKQNNKTKEQQSSQGPFIRLLENIYTPILRFFVNHRSVAVLLGMAFLAIGAIVFPRLGSEFTPKLQEGTAVLRLSMAPSIALTESTRITQIVERRLMNIEEINGVVTRIGRGEVGAHTDPVNSAEMYISLKPREEWTHGENQEELLDYIRHELGDTPGALMSFTQPIEMTVDELLEGVRAELAIKLFGDDLDILKEKADDIATVVSEVTGAEDVQPDQIAGAPQLLIHVNRDEIARYGINVSDVQETISAAIGGTKAGQLLQGMRRFDILVRYHEEHRSTREQIEELLIKSTAGAWVPLKELVDVSEITGPRQITRENNQRFITVQCNVSGRDIGSFVEEAQILIEQEVDLPPGYLVTWGGQFRLQQEANKRLLVVIPITLFLVFVLLYSCFKSMKNSLLIILNIPLALVGGVVALWISGQNLSVPSSVGFIALFGIALENGMVLVTYINQLIRNGVKVDEACVTAAKSRLRAVLMTALTTGLGLVPLLLADGIGSEVQRPLATVVVGGLFSSTALTLLVLPAIYRWFYEQPTEVHRTEHLAKGLLGG